jgi:hypothetical protein
MVPDYNSNRLQLAGSGGDRIHHLAAVANQDSLARNPRGHTSKDAPRQRSRDRDQDHHDNDPVRRPADNDEMVKLLRRDRPLQSCGAISPLRRSGHPYILGLSGDPDVCEQ